MLITTLRALHVVSAVALVAPLFVLLTVPAGRTGGFAYSADRVQEESMRRAASQALIYLVTALVTGFLAVALGIGGVAALWQNSVILLKLVIFVLLAGFLHAIPVAIQPKILTIVERGSDGSISTNDTDALERARKKRSLYAALSLALALAAVVLGLQVYGRMPWQATVVIIALTTVFSFRARSNRLRFGWW